MISDTNNCQDRIHYNIIEHRDRDCEHPILRWLHTVRHINVVFDAPGKR